MDLQFFKPQIFFIAPTREILERASGDNAKGVIVIASFLESARAEERDLLNKVLKSVQLDGTKDVLLIPYTPETPVSVSALCRQTGSRTVLLFGVEPGQAGLHFRANKYAPFDINGIRGLWADQLSALDKSRELKNALWTSLRTLFN